MDNTNELRNGKIGTLLWKFSWPAVIAMLVNSMYNIIDRIFVGRGVGSLAIAAATVAFPIMLTLLAVSALIGVGATSLISIRLGEKKPEEADKIAGNAVVLLVLLPLCISIIYFLFSTPILTFFGASAEVLPYAKAFTNIIMMASSLGSISMGMVNFIRAEGNPRMSMYTQVIGTVINIILNYIFVMKLGFGIRGSALATVCGQIFSSIWVLTYFLFGPSVLKIKLKNLKLQKNLVISIMSIGFAPFAMQLANSLQNTILNKALMNCGGDMALSAMGIVGSISTLMFMPILGISQGAQPIIGFNYGAKEFTRVKEALKKAVIVGTIIAVFSTAVVHLWPTQIANMFINNNPKLTQLTAHAMCIFFFMFPVAGFQIVSSQYFQAVGKPIQSTILGLSRQLFLLVPLLLILPRFWGIEGVWRTPPIADILAALITASVVFFEMKHIKEKENEQLQSSTFDGVVVEK
ncbi:MULTISPECIES: MATE family efflux transporter [Clostridium]|uniref:Multidrug export protein MepA n=3 Tax=Clostridium TaxID=1485 RepID=D8GTP1_CLOLD|nr:MULTISPECIES: MATE family efflux transporter [Clostridium]ADK14690.1 predicted efflux pump [Clostridium ljungdahlii DSM 13528]AGY77923.1 MATE family efflux transporter [Clostridium autoethanogenum DSM 10061]ALU38056.1 MATE efflux family protein [Clostridium autoethanogenum DSM 10061]OAA85927.1 Multidrug export protein MepA [Clostridium ljungdahlii DSM 13528]OVY50820.1 Multidrug export protein MepA [Clostridium autoethanogenum]